MICKTRSLIRCEVEREGGIEVCFWSRDGEEIAKSLCQSRDTEGGQVKEENKRCGNWKNEDLGVTDM